MAARMEQAGPKAQVPAVSSSEDGGSPLAVRRPSTGTLIKHSTPHGSPLTHSLRPPGEISYLSEGGPPGGSPMPAKSLLDFPSQLSGVSIRASFRKKRLSTVSASSKSSAQLGPDLEDSAGGGGPPASAPRAQQRQEGEVLRARSQPRNVELPGIPRTAGRRRRDPKKMAAEMERVRQWEFRLLQDIDEATRHELTIEDD